MAQINWTKIILFYILGLCSWVIIAIGYIGLGSSVNIDTSGRILTILLILLLISSGIIFYPVARKYKTTGGALAFFYLIYIVGFATPVLTFLQIFQDFGNFL